MGESATLARFPPWYLLPGISYSRYDPNRGYYWEFPDEAGQQGQKDTPSEAPARPEDPTDTQRRRVDSLLNDLMKKFPPKSFGKRVRFFKMCFYWNRVYYDIFVAE